MKLWIMVWVFFFFAINPKHGLTTEKIGSVLSVVPSKPKPKLRWIDAGDAVIDLDWNVTSEWVWLNKKAQARLWIELPALFGLRVPLDSSFRLLDRDHVSQLTAETSSPKLTGRFHSQYNEEADRSKEEVRVTGLEVTFQFDTPTILVHDHCKKSDFDIRIMSKGSHPFFFLAAYCSLDQAAGVTVAFQVSEDAEFIKTKEKKRALEITLDSRVKPTERLSIRQMAQDSVYEFEMSLKKAIPDEKSMTSKPMKIDHAFPRG